MNLQSIFFVDFSVNSQPIFMKYGKEYVRVPRRIFMKKYSIFRKLDHSTCSKFLITTSIYRPEPFKLVELKSVLGHELHYMPDGLNFG